MPKVDHLAVARRGVDRFPSLTHLLAPLWRNSLCANGGGVVNGACETVAKHIIYKHLTTIRNQFKGMTGYLCVATMDPDGGKWHHKFFKPTDNIGELSGWVKGQNEAGKNTYACWSLFKTPERKLSNMVVSAAFVADWDGGDPKVLNGVKPSAIVQTSTGREQHTYIHKPLDEEAIGGAYAAMRKELGCDPVSADMAHVWRIPGTTNWPNEKKRSEGREPEESLWVSGDRHLINISRWAETTPEEMGAWPDDLDGDALGASFTFKYEAKKKPNDASAEWAELVEMMARRRWGVNQIVDKMDDWRWKPERYATRVPQQVRACIESAMREKGLRLPVAARSGFDVVYFQDIEPVLDMNDFVQGLLMEGSSVVVYGQSNSGKTFWTVDLALHVAAGKRWNDRRVTQGGVLYCALEGGFGFRNRVAAWRETHTPATAQFAAIMRSLDLFDPDADTEELIHTVKNMPWPVKLLVIDTLARAMPGGDENKTQDMNVVVANMDKIRAETGACVMFVHHSGKDLTKGARGAGSLRGAIDTEIEISTVDGGGHVARVVKQRDIGKTDDIKFFLPVRVMGKNRYGEETTTCVVEPAPVFGDVQPIGTSYYEALTEAINDGDEPGRTTLENWRKKCFALGIINNKHKDPDSNFRVARKMLKEANWIKIEEEYAYDLKSTG